jgi:hypothetical protein
MNQDEVQVVVDAALAAAATTAANQQQVAIDAAVAAAAITAADQQQVAIDAAVAAAATTAANQQQVSFEAAVATAMAKQQQKLRPVAFSLSPGVANPTAPWDYFSSQGIKMYYQAVSPLSPKYKGDERSLTVFLSGLTSKANQYGWEELIMMIPDDTGVARSLLKHYALLTIPDIKKHALTYIGKESRASQASAQLAVCILASMNDDFLVKLLTHVRDYTVQGFEDGPCMLKAVISIVTIETKTAVPLIKKMLGDLGVLMEEVKSDITEFNLRVCDLMNRLRAAKEDYNELLDKLFEAYQKASNKTFVRYIAEKQSRWEDNELDLLPEALMAMAGDRYKTMVMKKTWTVPILRETQNVPNMRKTRYAEDEEESIIAMRAELAAERAKMAALSDEVTELRKSAATNGGGQIQEQTDDDQPKLKSSTKEPSEPNKKAIEYARALMHLMDFEDEDL